MTVFLNNVAEFNLFGIKKQKKDDNRLRNTLLAVGGLAGLGLGLVVLNKSVKGFMRKTKTGKTTMVNPYQRNVKSRVADPPSVSQPNNVKNTVESLRSKTRKLQNTTQQVKKQTASERSTEQLKDTTDALNRKRDEIRKNLEKLREQADKKAKEEVKGLGTRTQFEKAYLKTIGADNNIGKEVFDTNFFDTVYRYESDRLGFNTEMDFYKNLPNTEPNANVINELTKKYNFTTERIKTVREYANRKHNEYLTKSWADAFNVGTKNTKTKNAESILGVKPNATKDEIKNQYRKLVKQYHPDMNRNLPKEQQEEMAKKFREIQDAYDSYGFSAFLIDIAEFGAFGNVANNIANNKVGGFFLKHGDTVTRTTANGVTKKTRGLFNSGYGLRKRGMAAIGTPLVMYGGYKLKRKYDQYKPEIKMLRAYNNFKNKIQGV